MCDFVLSTQHLSEVNLHIDPLDENPAPGAPAKRHYEEDSSDEEPPRKTKQKVVKIDSANSSEDEE